MQNLHKFIGFTMIYIAMMFLMIFSQQPQAQAAEPTFGTVPSEPPQLLSGKLLMHASATPAAVTVKVGWSTWRDVMP